MKTCVQSFSVRLNREEEEAVRAVMKARDATKTAVVRMLIREAAAKLVPEPDFAPRELELKARLYGLGVKYGAKRCRAWIRSETREVCADFEYVIGGKPLRLKVELGAEGVDVALRKTATALRRMQKASLVRRSSVGVPILPGGPGEFNQLNARERGSP